MSIKDLWHKLNSHSGKRASLINTLSPFTGKSMQNDVAIFQEAAGQIPRQLNPGFTKFNNEQADLYLELIREEAAELTEAFNNKDIIKTADGAADLVWVVLGLCNTLGINFAPCWNTVARSNMSKIGPDGKVLRREDGKILKPDTFVPPDIRRALGLNPTEAV